MYTATVSNSSRVLTGKEKVQAIDTQDCVRLDKATQEHPEGVIIDINYWVVLDVHNDNAEDKDYQQYIFTDKDGTRYVTGSTTLWSTYENIEKAMAGESEPWKIKVFRKPSRNRAGKDFITCSIV